MGFDVKNVNNLNKIMEKMGLLICKYYHQNLVIST